MVITKRYDKRRGDSMPIIEDDDMYNLLLNKMYFNKVRNEREVFELWHDGENNCTIAKKLNVSEGTVRNRKKALTVRANELIKKIYNVV